MVKGKGARDKGSRAERKVRDILRGIYPSMFRKNVQRVPMSGAGYIKGDVADMNDTDTCYEVKCHEKLAMPSWWRQTKSQAKTRTPVLVVTQNYRPYYFIMRAGDWFSLQDQTEYQGMSKLYEVGKNTTFFDDMAKLEPRDLGSISLDDDECVVIASNYYTEVKTSIFLHERLTRPSELDTIDVE